MNGLSLSNLGEQKKTLNPLQVRYNCPFCEDGKFRFYVHLRKRLYHCQKCKSSGKIEELKSTVSEFEEKVNKFMNPKVGVKEKEADINFPASGYKTPITKEDGLPYKYLIKRGITDLEMKKYSMGYCSHGLFSERIIIPVYDNKKLVYFVARSFTNLVPKYLNSPSPKEEVIFKTFDGVVDRAIVVEGIFDAIRVGKIFPAIALLGKRITKGQINKIMEVAKSVIVVLDQDAHTYAWQVKEQLGYYLDTRIILLNEHKDPGSMKVSDIKQLINGETK